MDKHKKFIKELIEILSYGYSIDECAILELLETHNLIKYEIYDPEKHDFSDIEYLVPGEDQIWLYIGDEDAN